MDQNPPPEYVDYPRGAVIDPREYYGPPDFRIGAINEAWTILKGDMVTWVVGCLLIGVIAAAIVMPAQFYTTFRALSNNATPTAPDIFIVDIVCSLASTIVVGIYIAGFYRVALQRMRMSYEGLGGMFNVNGQGAKLALWSALIGLPNVIIGTVYTVVAPVPDQTAAKTMDLATLFVPLFLFLGAMVVVSLLLFPFFLTPLLIVDQKLSIKEAALKSLQAVAPRYFRALGFYICAAFVSGIGVLACGIGALFTMPLFYLMVAIAYRDHFMPPLSGPHSSSPTVAYEQSTGTYP